ncbi:hypothetical protein IBX73_07530 [candidate division WOR-3 bacterium]|nr:hypothetical protein [candidate division WOR-3 bacterium]
MKTLPQHLRLFSVLLLVAIFLFAFGCTDPEEYDPSQPLDPPPAAPTIIYPLADTNLCGGILQNVFFDWNALPGAQIYQIQVDSTLAFTTAELLQFTQPPAYIALIRYAETATYYAVIRAASTSWSNYTNWSEPRRFFLRPDP